MARALKTPALLVLAVVAGVAPGLRAQDARPPNRELDAIVREIQLTPTTFANLRERELVISQWARRLKDMVDLRGVFEMKDREGLRQLVVSDPDAAVKIVDGIIRKFAALDPGAIPAPPVSPASRTVSFACALTDVRVIDLAAKDGAAARGVAAAVVRERLTVTLLGTPVAVVPSEWTGRAPGGRSGMLGVLGDYLPHVAEEAPQLGYGMVKLSGRNGLNWAVYRLGGPEIPAGAAYLDLIAKNIELAGKAGLEVLLVIEPSAEKERRQAAFTKQEMKAQRIPFSAGDVPAYREFLKTVFTRFPTVKLYALGNESDISMQPEDYARALRATHDIMQQQRPGAELVTSGYLRDQGTEYFEKVFKALDGEKAFDHFDMRHIFGYYRELDLLRREYAAAKGLLDRFGFSGVDIWMTETSVPARMPGRPDTSDEAQAVEVISRHLTAFALGVKKVFWTGVVDHVAFGGERQGYFSYVGLASNPMSGGPAERRPAYFAYRALSDIIAQAEMRSIRPVEAGENVAGYTLNAGSGPVYILWRTD